MKPLISALYPLIIILGILIGTNSIAIAQQGDIIPTACSTATYTLSPGTTIHFYDDGGPGGDCSSGGDVADGNYENANCETITTICPAPGETLSVDFVVLSMYATTSGWDWMIVYEGPTTNGNVLFDNSSTGPDNPNGTDCSYDGTAQFCITDECLTFRFYATSVVNKEGWDAIVSSSPASGSGSIDIDVTAPTCSADGFAEITNYDNTLNYIFTPAGPSIDPSGEIIGATFGQSYSVELDNAPCSGSYNFQIEEQLAAPDAPVIDVTAPTCSADGYAEITNYDASLNYTFTPSGPTINSTGEITGATFGQNYSVEVNNNAGCGVNTANFQVEEQLVAPDTPDINVTAPTCSADGFAEITNYDAGSNYTFTPGGPSISASGQITGATFGQNYSVEISNANCTVQSTFQIEEQFVTPAVPDIDITAPTCFADGYAEIINYDAGLNYTFSPAGPTLGTSGEIIGAAFGQNYSVEVDNSNCTADTTFQVEEQFDTPTPDFYADFTQGCSPHTVTFINTSGFPNASCTWDFGDGNTSNLCDTVFHTYSGEVVYDVTLTLESSLGCIGDTTFVNYIEVANNPVADFTADPMITDYNDTEVSFTNESTDANSYVWDFGDSSPQSNDVDPVHEFPNGVVNNYTVTLYATGDLGCMDSTTLVIIINSPDIDYTIPNVFTPNADNSNDYFEIIDIENISELEIVVLNRWGNVVFESEEIDFKWNGLVQNSGQECSDGTYFYKVKLKDLNGEEFNEHGFVHLSRGK